LQVVSVWNVELSLLTASEGIYGINTNMGPDARMEYWQIGWEIDGQGHCAFGLGLSFDIRLFCPCP